MKTQFKRKPSPRHSSLTTTKRALAGSLLLAGSAALVGCQSTATGLNTTASTHNMSQSAAKTALSKALQKQRRRSFSYHSNIEMSNEQQLSDIDQTKLVATSLVSRYCEKTHDTAYANLIAQAQAQNVSVSAPQYDAERRALKASYLDCSAAYQAWRDNKNDDDYDSYYDNDNDVYGSENDIVVNERDTISNSAEVMSAEQVAEEGATLIESSRIKTNAPYSRHSSNTQSSTRDVSPYYQQLFDEYATKTTPLDVKKAQLFDNYVLKPLSINAQGVYQPLAGKLTMLMSAQYQARNHHTSINQPIYIDFKNGDIYLWADNFALLTSEFADDKLGVQWQNKWLKLTIDDGSLPKGFGRAVINAHFEALDKTYEAAPVSQFSYVAPSKLPALLPKLSAPQLKAMTTLPSKTIIHRVQSAESYEQFYEDYISIFYELITNQYPELIVSDSTSVLDMFSDDASEAAFTSKVVVQQALAIMKNLIDRQADRLVSEVFDAAAPSNTTTELAAIDQPTVQHIYGLNQSGQIQWQYHRSQLIDKQSATKGVMIEVLQQYRPISSATDFPNLPADRQVPNASNSVDLREYGRELMQYYQEGKGTAVGKMLYDLLPMTNATYSSTILSATPEQNQQGD